MDGKVTSRVSRVGGELRVLRINFVQRKGARVLMPVRFFFSRFFLSCDPLMRKLRLCLQLVVRKSAGPFEATLGVLFACVTSPQDLIFRLMVVVLHTGRNRCVGGRRGVGVLSRVPSSFVRALRSTAYKAQSSMESCFLLLRVYRSFVVHCFGFGFSPDRC